MSATSLIVSRQVCAYDTDWFAVQVLPEQFSLTSKGPLTPAFADLAIGILSLVPETPMTAIGLNFLAHYRLASDADYHRVGDVLAPKTIWTSLYPEPYISAGLADLTIRIQRTDEHRQPTTEDEKRISVQPSGRFRSGVFFSYNDHHVITPSVNKLPPGEKAAATIETHWAPAWKDAIRTFDGVLSAALANTEGAS